MATKYELRYASHPEDMKSYDTERLRKEFVIEEIFAADTLQLVYSLYDRYIVGGAMPKSKDLPLETIDPLKANFFLERRELGVINVGDAGSIMVDGQEYLLLHKEALYIGRGAKEVIFKAGEGQPLFYINSAPAHQAYPTKLITRQDANVIELGSMEESNHRVINQMIVSKIVDCCQMQMGFTELKPGSVWNTMPAHVHNRRMEAYFYFELEKPQAVCHFMGETSQTRHLWLKNHQGVLSPSWSIHSGCGTSNYTFIWGMAGENLDYDDMDKARPDALR
ncbi:MAG: 5-dehydro-4-deoxy-D-glucuronate isomerase [Cytophagales bacterium]|nr:5-dehydro-4-deoxy-D-glucuronate isomerase [Cytophagales bacterium]